MSSRRRPLLALAAVALAAAVAGAADRPIEVRLDATDAPRNRVRAALTVPADPGPLTLYYPKWIPGEHAPTGPITDLTGLTLKAGGTPLPWTRDDHDAHAVRVTVPAGATAVEATVEFLATPNGAGFSKGASCTPRLAVLSWNQVILYPKGKPITEQAVKASLVVPNGWSVGTALPVAGRSAARTDFDPVSVEQLCDSPVLCGKHYKEVPLGPASGPPHLLCVAADTEDALDLSDDTKAALDRLVTEATAVFGAPRYRSYRFLVALSDHVAHFGLEHHECSDNRGPLGMLIDPLYRNTWHAWLLSHEYVHSWNGKFRRPAGMIAPDFQRPLNTRLLWVYEGLTEYYGFVLAARSGLWTADRARENFARVADRIVHQTSRGWRSLDDTAATAGFQYEAREDGWFRRRGVDFYDEAALVWLDADTLIREGTKGAKSLDDFCRRFHGGDAGPPAVRGYELADVVKELNAVYAHDWARFFADRVSKAGAEPPLAGLTRGGWSLTYAGERTEHQKSLEDDTKTVELSASLGLILKDDGSVVDVVPGKPADAAGVAAGMKVISVNGRRWTASELRAAVAKGTVRLVTEQADVVSSFTLKYAGGEKYPTLTRAKGTADLLGAILSPRGGATGS